MDTRSRHLGSQQTVSPPPPPGYTDTPSPSFTRHLVEVVIILLRRRRRFYVLVGAFVGLTLLHGRLATPQYTAQAVFTPETDVDDLSAAGLGGLAARFGFGSNLGTVPLPFYAELLLGDQFLKQLVEIPVSHTAEDGVSITQSTLLELYADSLDDRPEQLDAVSGLVRGRTTATLNRDANLVTVEYTAEDPVLAASVTNTYLDLVNRFNVTQRQSRAKSLRRFAEEVALPRAAEELQGSEDRLAAFYAGNRNFASSPTLRLEEARLQRRISIKQQSYLELAAQVEQARVDEVRNTPVITTVSEATPPIDPSSPLLFVNIPLAVILAVSVGILWALAEEYLTTLKSGYPATFIQLKQETGDAIRPLRRLLPPSKARRQ